MSALFLKSLVAGAAEGAGESIEKRNTEIRKNAMAEFEMLRKEAGEKTEKLQTKRDELTSMAGALSSYRDGKGVQLTETQITGLLMQPIKAKQILKTLESEKDLSNVDFQKLLKVGGKVEMAPEEYIKRTTSIPQGLPQSQPTQVPKGAFGLESPAYGEAQSQFEAASGRKLSDIRAMALTPTERIEPVPLEVDLSQFKNPDTVATITARLRDAKADGEDMNSPKNQRLSKQLIANASIENQFKGGDDGKRTAGAIRSVLNDSFRVGLQAYELNKQIKYNQLGEPEYIGDVKGINKYAEDKRALVENQMTELGYMKDGKVSKNQAARDALLPYASFDKEDNVIWRKPKIGTETPASPAGPKAGAPSTVTAPTEKDISVPAPAILTEDGKGVNRQAMQKTYKAGQVITLPNGQVKIWNGITLQ